MNAKFKIVLTAGALALGFAAFGCATATAQTSVPEAATVEKSDPTGVTPLRRVYGVIPGAPYSAHIESESTQTLADGTTIHHKSRQANLFRDSEGRSRREQFAPASTGQGDADTPSFITIEDPTTGEIYSLNPRDHTAREMNRLGPVVMGTREPSDRIAAINPGAVPPIDGTTDGSSTSSRRIRPKITTENLGTQEMEGLAVEGRRTTTEYPTGAQGNDRPFSVVTETWTSKELGLTVLSKRNDPRYGESVTRMTDIHRHEPDESLFQVPVDYTIVKQETVAVDPQ